MFLSILVVLLALATTWAGAAELDSDGSPSNRIIGGRPAQEGERPYQVSLRLRTFGSHHICGGSLITPKHVLTAAHCLRYLVNDWLGPPIPVQELFVVAGQLSVTVGNYSISRNALRYKEHKYFNVNTIENDIAVLEVDLAFPISPLIDTIALREALIPNTGGTCFVSGWGGAIWSTITPPPSPTLQVLKVNILEKYKCDPLGLFMMRKICAGREDVPAGACKGDSGGPLVCDGLLTGIASTGNTCSSPQSPSTYVEVARYLDWIRFYMRS